MPLPLSDALVARVKIGTQGWNYPAWKGPLYPDGTPARDFLRLYARAFDTVEVDSTFYAIPEPGTVRGWADRTPDDFVFSLKLPAEITHQRRLRDTSEVLGDFLDNVALLGSKLGPLLVQLGPDFSPRERDALESFLDSLPNGFMFAVEFRHAGWIADDILDGLARRGIALAVTDGPWVPRERMLELAAFPTADFLYVRWMGADRTLTDYSRIQIDRAAEIAAWADALSRAAASGAYVYGYVNNHFSGHSPATARSIQKLLGQDPTDPAEVAEQISLF